MNANLQIQRTKLNELSGKIIGLCIEIHRELGPGLVSHLCASVVQIKLGVFPPPVWLPPPLGGKPLRIRLFWRQGNEKQKLKTEMLKG